MSSYGLELQPDPTYPMYCSIYDEGNDHDIITSTVATTEEIIIPNTTESNKINVQTSETVQQ